MLQVQWSKVKSESHFSRSLPLVPFSQGSSGQGLTCQYHSGRLSELSSRHKELCGSQTLHWVELNVPNLSAVHISGLENWAASFLSWETFNLVKWSLSLTVFLQIYWKWGSRDVDLFLSHFNQRIMVFVFSRWICSSLLGEVSLFSTYHPGRPRLALQGMDRSILFGLTNFSKVHCSIPLYLSCI